MWWTKKSEKCKTQKEEDITKFRETVVKKELVTTVKELFQDISMKDRDSDRSTFAQSRQLYSQSIYLPRQTRNSTVCQIQTDLQKMVAQLKVGHRMIKHSQNTKQPHDKHVYLSQDEQFLCWRSPSKSDEKKILIKNIASLTIGKLGKGLQKQIKIKKIDLNKCVVIQSSQRTLELEAESQQVIQLFVEYLKAIINNSFKFHFHLNLLK